MSTAVDLEKEHEQTPNPEVSLITVPVPFFLLLLTFPEYLFNMQNTHYSNY